MEKFRKNKSIPLVEVADVFAVYVTHGQGAEGVLDQASNSTLEVSICDLCQLIGIG